MTVAYSGTRQSFSPAIAQEDGYLPRPQFMPFLYFIPMTIAGISWVSGGITGMTDLAFILVTILGFAFLTLEYVHFPRRFGIGGMMILGGYLTWFCYDYFKNWYGWEFTEHSASFEPVVVAKAAYFHMMFIMCALFGLQIPMKKAQRVLQLVHEPNDSKLYFIIILAVFAFAISPYFLFTRDPWYIAIYNSISAARGAGGAVWITGRDAGRLNYSWGAYIAQIIQVGQVGGQFAVFYAILIARSHIQKIICWLIWAFWLATAFGSGTRGVVAFMMLPVLALVFLKYQAFAAIYMRKISPRAYVLGGIILFALVFLVQVQGKYRTLGYQDMDITSIDVLELKGNSMFTEGLVGWEAIPDRVGFFYNTWPGASLIRPIPDTVFWFVVKIIPRALWKDKPLEEMEEWYHEAATGGNFQATISTGLVGEWYFKYGWLGVVQGGLLFGWLARMAERGLQTAEGRPMVILLSLGLATWLFRCFRNFMFHDIYPLIIGAVVIYVVVKITNHFSSPGAAPTRAVIPTSRA